MVPIVVENNKLMAVSDWIDNNNAIRFIVYGTFYYFNLIFGYLIMSGRYKLIDNKEKLIISLLIVIAYILKINYINFYIYLELLVILLIPIIIRKRKWYLAIFNIVLISVWQLTMLFVRGIDDLNIMPFIVALVLQIDYYIFLIILYLKGRWNLMGFWGMLFWGKSVEELEEMLKIEKLSDKPNLEKIEAIEKAIHNAKIEEKKKELDNEKVE